MSRSILKVHFSPRGFLLPKMILAIFLAVGVSPVGVLAQAAVSGVVVGSDTSTVSEPNNNYAKPNQSRIWYNSHQNRWDAVVPQNDGGTSDHYIMKDVSGSQTFTSIELEDRNNARPDVFWDDDNGKLYVLGSHNSLSEFWQLDYNASADSYDNFNVGSLGAGVAVPGITHVNGNSPATLYVSPNGDVWVAVMKAGGLEIQHSADGGATWMNSPVNLDSSVKLGVTTWIHFEYQGATYLGVFAGENGEDGANTLFYFWFINQKDNPKDLNKWVDDPPPGSMGVEQSDDHVSAARDANGNMYFAVKTEGGNATDPLIKLYKRTPGGAWSQFKVTETQEVPEESRPSMVIDEENVEIYIYTNGAEVVTDPYRNGVRVKAKLNALEDLIIAEFITLFDGRPSGEIFTDIISPRHPVNSESGVVVLAHNRTDETVWFSAEEIQPSTGACDTIPGTFPLYSGEEINIEKNGVEVNGNSVSKGKWKGDSVVRIDGTPAWVSQSLPIFDPSSFPVNTSKTDISDLDWTVSSSKRWFRKKVTIKKNKSRGFIGGGPFYIDELKLEENATVNLAAGTYYVNKLKLDKDDATIKVMSQQVILHIGKEAKLSKKNITVNFDGEVEDLVVYLHSGAKFSGGENLDFTGLIYGLDNKEVELKKETNFRGAIITSGKIKIKEDVSIIYSYADQAAVSDVIVSCDE